MSISNIEYRIPIPKELNAIFCVNMKINKYQHNNRGAQAQ